MPKKKSKRGFKLIAFKAYYDTDQDILDWWEGIQEGERSDSMRDLIREQLCSVRRKPGKAPIIDLPELLEVRRDTGCAQRHARLSGARHPACGSSQYKRRAGSGRTAFPEHRRLCREMNLP